MSEDHKDSKPPAPALTALAPGGRTQESVPLPYGPDQPGTRVGRYRLVSPLGQGGMGTVWLALRDDGAFERKVALKLLHLSLAKSDWHARFLQERQIHAGLQHPNIAAMFDGGLADDGRPYFVMEYVDGCPINQFCDQHQLSIHARVRLFLQVLGAVAHAHQHLIVHRDLKPGNILVTPGRVVKLLDFGIAKLLGESGQGASVRAEENAMTPRYAAPEQVRGEAVSMATDVYSLGVVLYELLTGRSPYRVDTQSPEALQQAVVSCEPIRPTILLGRPDDTTVLEPERVEYERKVGLARIRRELSGDLEHIVLKALRKNSAERYAWAEALALDLSNYLDDRPISARASNWRYRFGKWLRRHTLAAATGVVVLSLLVTGLFVLDAQRQRATTAATRAQVTQAFLEDLFEQADPDQGGGATTSVRDVLSRGAARLEHDLTQQPELRHRLNALIGRLMNAVGDYAYAEPVLRAALAMPDAGAGEAGQTAQTRMQLALSLQHQGKFDEAEALLLQVLADAPPDSATQADACTYLGGLYALTNRFDEAIAKHALAVSIWRKKGTGEAANLALALTESAAALAYADQLDEAHAQLDEAVGILRQPGHSSVQLGEALYKLGDVELRRGHQAAARADLEQAVALLRERLGADHKTTLMARRVLADTLDELGDVETAGLQLRQILADASRRYGEEARISAEVANSLAAVALKQGRYSEAEASFRLVVQVLERDFGPEHLETATARANLSNVLFEQGRFAEAEAVLRQALDAIQAVVGDDSSDYASTEFALARIQRFHGDLAAAERSLAHAERVFAAVFGEQHAMVLRTRLTRAALALDRGTEDPTAILATLVQIESLLDDGSRRGRVARVELLVARARAQIVLGDARAAEAVLLDVLELAREVWPAGSRLRAEAMLELAGVRLLLGDVAAARAGLREADAANAFHQPLAPHSAALREKLARL